MRSTKVEGRIFVRPSNHALTSGTFGTEPRRGESPPPPPPPFGPGGLLRRADGGRRFGLARGTGTFSGFGVTGPSRNSKPSLSRPAPSLVTITLTCPPFLSLPNNTSSASGFL